LLSVAAQLEHALDEQRRVAAAAGDSLATQALT
jgi:hypothetical protein